MTTLARRTAQCFIVGNVTELENNQESYTVWYPK